VDLTSIPVLGLLIQLVLYLIGVLPDIAPIALGLAAPIALGAMCGVIGEHRRGEPVLVMRWDEEEAGGEEEVGSEEAGNEEAGGAEEGRRGVVLPEYRDRAASPADVAAVVELLRAHELADHGRVTADWNEIVRSVWRDPTFDLQADGWIVERGDVPVAFAGVFHEDVDNGETSTSWMASPPTDRAGGVLPFLVDRLVKRARERGARSLRHLVYRNDDAHRTVVLERGFRRVRSEWTMHREIDPDEPIGGSPDGIRLTTLAEHPDERGLHRADQ